MHGVSCCFMMFYAKLEEWQAPLDFNSSSVEDDNMEGGGRACGLCVKQEKGGRGEGERERREGEGRKRKEGG